MTDTEITTGSSDTLKFTGTLTCSFCDEQFEQNEAMWSDICPACRACPECGSQFQVRYSPGKEGCDGPRLARCLACLHGWESPADGA